MKSELIFENIENPEYLGVRDGNDVKERLWKSRSVAVAVLLFDIEGRVLFTERGPDVADTGNWCFPCGFLDWNESTLEAAIRELWEEVRFNCYSDGLIDPLTRYEVMDDPKKDHMENVVFHYYGVVGGLKPELTLPDLGEVTNYHWTTQKEVESKFFDGIGEESPHRKSVEFSFNHGERAAKYRDLFKEQVNY